MSNRKRYAKKPITLQPALFKVGDSVIVKPGTQDPDYAGDIGGWQGRITEITGPIWVSGCSGSPTTKDRVTALIRVLT